MRACLTRTGLAAQSLNYSDQEMYRTKPLAYSRVPQIYRVASAVTLISHICSSHPVIYILYVKTE